jgi:hypothetical protein
MFQVDVLSAKHFSIGLRISRMSLHEAKNFPFSNLVQICRIDECSTAVLSLLSSCQAEENAPDESDQTQKDDTSLDGNQGKVDDRSQRPNLVASKDDREKVL